MNIAQLTTEQRNPKTLRLDTMTVKEIITVMNQEDRQVPAAIEVALPQIEQAIHAIIRSFQQGGRLIYMGAGTSGRLGVLDAAECVPTFGVSPEMVVGLIAGGEQAMTEAVEGAEDNQALGEQDLQAIKLTAKDTVVGIAASGRTPYVIGGLSYASQQGATTVAVACNPQSIISHYSQIAIEVDCGPEILSGSTRLKAGTAQKLILNMLSTASMVGIGKVYQNLMVDVLATNEKLDERAKRIIMDATRVDLAQATEAFNASDKQVKVAIVMLLTGTSAQQAMAQLHQSQGFIHKVITENEGGAHNDN